jgi:hypothetical protein
VLLRRWRRIPRMRTMGGSWARRQQRSEEAFATSRETLVIAAAQLFAIF